MKSFAIILLLLVPVILHGQTDRKLIRHGYKSYMDGNYNDAEVEFRKAEDLNKESFTARYNTSTALYKQDEIDESAQRFEELLAETTNDIDEAKLYHNLGNSFLETDKLEESIEAYKKSLRLNPSDEDTRYNLSYALEKLAEQQQQQQQQQDQENKDGEDNQENKDDQQKENDKSEDQQDKQDDQSEEEKEQEQNSGDENKEDDQEQEQNQPQAQQLSKEDAERLLNAILQKEKDVKEKVDKKKAATAKIKTDKDW